MNKIQFACFLGVVFDILLCENLSFFEHYSEYDIDMFIVVTLMLFISVSDTGLLGCSMFTLLDCFCGFTPFASFVYM